MTEVKCPQCNSLNLFADGKCKLCGEKFSKYKLVSTSESVNLVPKDKISKYKIKGADRERFPLVFFGIFFMDIILIVIIGLSYGQVICGDMGCLPPIIISFFFIVTFWINIHNSVF